MRRIELPGDGFGRWHPDGSAPFASWRDWLLSIREPAADSRIDGWHTALHSVPGAAARFERGYAALVAAARALPEPRHVVHGDLTAGNVLVDAGRITAVFDWGNSIAGDPLYDVGWLTFWAPWHPGIDVAELRRHLEQRFDDRDAAHRVRSCALHVGLDAQRFCAWASRWEELARVGERTLRFAA
jgi:hygromycin-B 4-O-kinase